MHVIGDNGDLVQGGAMGYTIGALRDKIIEMYPELEKNGVALGLLYNAEKDTYFVNFSKGRKVFATHLEKKETDACMDGVKFSFLGSQIGHWMNNLTVNQTEAADMPANNK